MDWAKLELEQPNLVVKMISDMHRSQDWRMNELLRTIITSWGIFTGGKQHRNWKIYTKQLLPCILMDIMSEPDMFSKEQGVFKVRPSVTDRMCQ